ncbi:MAG: diguanylate cyclase, partial [Actinobacteria bacterium]
SEGRPVRITAVFGVAEFVPGTDALGLVRRADEALYQAKRRGKNRVESAVESAVVER